MKQLEALGMVQYFLYEREDLQLGRNTAFLGPNGTGKTALLDAFQIVLLAADSNKTHFNASGEGKKRARTLREYCLGVYGQSDAERCRTSANTYIDLVFRDPYFLDFLGLRQGYDEADLEAAILRQLEAFILELGRGFAFVERQKRMVIDGEDFYLDLLFYHRRLRRLVAIELKLGRFKAAHKGQMELYLKWLDKHERQAGEEAPIGLILCAESSREQVELLQMHKDGITVAEYWTELPPKAELEQHLHQALLEARERLARRGVLLEGGEDA